MFRGFVDGRSASSGRAGGGEAAISVYIATDNTLVLNVLRTNVESLARFRVRGGGPLCEAARHTQAAVLMIDGNGAGLDRLLQVAGASDTRALLIGDFIKEKMCYLLSRGARGFLGYNEIHRKLPRAIEVVASGRLYVPRNILESFVAYTRKPAKAGNGTLTPRQQEVLQLLQYRYTNKEIGSSLSISENTVKFHLWKIYSKFNIHDRDTAKTLSGRYPG